VFERKMLEILERKTVEVNLCLNETILEESSHDIKTSSIKKRGKDKTPIRSANVNVFN
jgi:hypothetical protein